MPKMQQEFIQKEQVLLTVPIKNILLFFKLRVLNIHANALNEAVKYFFNNKSVEEFLKSVMLINIFQNSKY